MIGVRFLPSGRVIGGLAAGVVRYPVRRYAIGAGVAETVWASYSVGAGYFSGRAASNSFYALALGWEYPCWSRASARWRSGSHGPGNAAGGGLPRPSAVIAASVAGGGVIPAPGPAEPPLTGAVPASVPPPAQRIAEPSVGPRTVGPPARPREGGDGTVSCSSAGRRR